MVILIVNLVFLELSNMFCAFSSLLHSAIFFPQGMTFLGKGMNALLKGPAYFSLRDYLVMVGSDLLLFIF